MSKNRPSGSRSAISLSSAATKPFWNPLADTLRGRTSSVCRQPRAGACFAAPPPAPNASGEDLPVEIPRWESLHHQQIMKLARSINGVTYTNAADAKGAIRMNSRAAPRRRNRRNLGNEPLRQRTAAPLPSRSIAPIRRPSPRAAPAIFTAINGAWIDRTLGGAIGLASSAKVVVAWKTTLAANKTLSLAFKMQDADTSGGSGSADAGVDAYPNGAAYASTAVVTNSGSGSTLTGTSEFDVNLTGLRQFVRAVITPDLNASGTDGDDHVRLPAVRLRPHPDQRLACLKQASETGAQGLPCYGRMSDTSAVGC